MSLVVKNMSIRDYGPIKALDCDFTPTVNTIVGMNGCGKTTLIELLAAATGKKKCIQYVSGREARLIRIEVLVDGSPAILTISGEIESEQLREFRKLLGKYCSNFGQDEHGAHPAISGICDFSKAQNDIQDFLSNRDNMLTRFRGYASGDGFSMPMGDGYLQYIKLIYLKNFVGGPLLLDLPERHLDIVAKRQMYLELFSSHEQVILSTHTPEFLSMSENIIDLS